MSLISAIAKFAPNRPKWAGLFLLLLPLGLLAAGCGRDAPTLDRNLEKWSRAKLDDAAEWFITTGLGEYYRTEDMRTLKTRIETLGFYNALLSETQIEGEHHVAEIVVRNNKLKSRITCYARNETAGTVAEYWIVKTGPADHLDEELEPQIDTTFEFIIAKAEDVNGDRTIVKRDTTFFPSYAEGDVVVSFPMEDEVVYRLECWESREEFEGTPLGGFKMVKTKKGFKREPLDKKKWYQIF